jgi:hypothetical protein
MEDNVVEEPTGWEDIKIPWQAQKGWVFGLNWQKERMHEY